MIDEKKIPQRIYIKDYQLATCETDGIADARINAVPYKGGVENYANILILTFYGMTQVKNPK
jgi:hypothetical protein